MVYLSRFGFEIRSSNIDIWIFIECHRMFCSRHSIIHRHQSKQEQIPTEKYNRHVHLDQIAEWEQADEARHPLIAPPTPITQTSPSTILIAPFTRLLISSSNFDKQVLINYLILFFCSLLLLMNMNYYLMKH